MPTISHDPRLFNQMVHFANEHVPLKPSPVAFGGFSPTEQEIRAQDPAQNAQMMFRDFFGDEGEDHRNDSIVVTKLYQDPDHMKRLGEKALPLGHYQCDLFVLSQKKYPIQGKVSRVASSYLVLDPLIKSKGPLKMPCDKAVTMLKSDLFKIKGEEKVALRVVAMVSFIPSNKELWPSREVVASRAYEIKWSGTVKEADEKHPGNLGLAVSIEFSKQEEGLGRIRICDLAIGPRKNPPQRAQLAC